MSGLEHIGSNFENGKPYPSWIWIEVISNNEVVGGYWDAPKADPGIHGKKYVWNEEILDWVEVIDNG
jgi:hypothetical protein